MGHGFIVQKGELTYICPDSPDGLHERHSAEDCWCTHCETPLHTYGEPQYVTSNTSLTHNVCYKCTITGCSSDQPMHSYIRNESCTFDNNKCISCGGTRCRLDHATVEECETCGWSASVKLSVSTNSDDAYRVNHAAVTLDNEPFFIGGDHKSNGSQADETTYLWFDSDSFMSYTQTCIGDHNADTNKKMYKTYAAVAEDVIIVKGESDTTAIINASTNGCTIIIPKHNYEYTYCSAAASLGKYALFTGYKWLNGSTECSSKILQLVDSDGTHQLSYYASGDYRHDVQLATIDNTAIVVGGISNYVKNEGDTSGKIVTSIHCSTVDMITLDSTDDNVILSQGSDAPWTISEGAATTVGTYAIFAGGITVGYTPDGYSSSSYKINYSPLVCMCNKDGTFTILDNLQIGRIKLAATTLSKYALFAGGCTQNGATNAIDIYDEEGTHITAYNGSSEATLSAARYDLAATTCGKYALFSGGRDDSSVYNTIDMISIN